MRSIPLLASHGCPYTCPFCSDAELRFHPIDPEQIEDDVRFARDRWPRALLTWHDPTFGVRFDEVLSAVERGVEGRPTRFLAETTLSLLTPERVRRLSRAGFIGLMPGAENWEDFGSKMGRSRQSPRNRMESLSEQMEEYSRLIPFLQVNFVLGVDPSVEARGTALTLEFLRRVPGVWPNLNLFQAWGRLSPMGRALAEEGRLLDVPLPLLDQKVCVNVVGDVRPSIRAHLTLLEASITGAAIRGRLAANRDAQTRIVNLLKGLGQEQRKRIRWHRRVLYWLEHDRPFRAFFDGTSSVVPEQLRALARDRIGPFAALLPEQLATEVRTGRFRASADLGTSIDATPA